jgi:hypothetical protein
MRTGSRNERLGAILRRPTRATLLSRVGSPSDVLPQLDLLRLIGSCEPRQRALAAQISLLGLRQDITEDEPRSPNDFTDLDPDGARENRPLEYKRVELAVFTARVHAFR